MGNGRLAVTGLGERDLHFRLRTVEENGTGQAGGPHGGPVHHGLVEQRLVTRRDRIGKRQALISCHGLSPQDDPIEDVILAHRRQHRQHRGRQIHIQLVVLGKKAFGKGKGRGGKHGILRGLRGTIGGDADREEQRQGRHGRGREELPDELALQRSAETDGGKAVRQGSGGRRIGHGKVRR